MGVGGSSLREKDLKMLEMKTGFTRDQIKGWHEAFMNECPNGRITKHKFTSLYKKMFPEGKTAAFYQHMFRAFDSDNSGSLEFAEFMEAVSITERGRPEEILDFAFRMYDVDRSGMIEMRELSEILRALYSLRIQDPAAANEMFLNNVREVMRKLDVNRDGVLSKDEFVRGCMHDPEIRKLLLGGIR